MSLQYPVLVLCAGVLIGIMGCSRSIESGGTIKYADGEPLPSGMIFFSNGQNTYDSVIDNGTFKLGGMKVGEGVPAGSYRVHILGTLPTEGTEAGVPVVAEKYMNTETSGITCEVKKGEKNSFEIVVERYGK